MIAISIRESKNGALALDFETWDRTSRFQAGRSSKTQQGPAMPRDEFRNAGSVERIVEYASMGFPDRAQGCGLSRSGFTSAWREK